MLGSKVLFESWNIYDVLLLHLHVPPPPGSSSSIFLRRRLKIHTPQKSSFLVEFFKVPARGKALCVFFLLNVSQRHEIHFTKIFTVVRFMEYIFPSISSLLEKFSTLKWPWLETKTEKKTKQHFLRCQKKFSARLYHSWRSYRTQHKVKRLSGLFFRSIQNRILQSFRNTFCHHMKYAGF